MFIHPMWDPTIITFAGISIRWYGLAYLLAVLTVVQIGKYEIKAKKLQLTIIEFDRLVTGIILGIIIGGRLGYMLFYQTSELITEPFTVFKIWQGGMSFHGGLLGVLIAIIYNTRNQAKFWHVADFITTYAPIGLMLGRFANFINGELCGRITKDYWFSMIYPWLGTEPRHPSQIYEMILEGFVLLSILVVIRSKNISKPGITSACFCLFYGSFRFILEFFRAPDPQIGFIWHNWLTMGQLLSLPMLIFGSYLFYRQTWGRT